MNSHQERYDFAIEIAEKLAAYQREFNAPDLHIEKKEDRTPVTEADKKSEAMFREAVAKRFPDDLIFGEEEDGAESAKTRWVLDPIDGTRKFMRGLPFWGICIAFEEDGEVQLGVIAVPAQNKIYAAQKGRGAYLNGKRITIDNSITSIEDAFVTMPPRNAFVSINAEGVFDAFQNNIEHDPGFLDAFSYGMVADGRIHGLVSCCDKWWDIAAAVCIVEEAGGVFKSIEGEKPNESTINIATTPELFESLSSFAKKSLMS